MKKLLIFIPLGLCGCSTIIPRPEPSTAKTLIENAGKELDNPSIQACPVDAVNSIKRAKIQLVDAQKELDKLKNEVTTLQEKAEQAQQLEKEILKKDKRIWQLWCVIIGAAGIVAFGIIAKLGLLGLKIPFL